MTLEGMFKALREKNWTQQRLAAELGVAQSTISKWENGQVEHFAPLDKLVALYGRECGAYAECDANSRAVQ